MNISIVNEDKVIIVDGEGLKFDFDLADNIWAIQWNGTKGEVEYRDDTLHLELTDFSDYQYLVDAYYTEKARLAQVKVDEAAAIEAAKTYADRRAEEYPDIGDQLDDLFHAGAFSTEMTATIQAVKDKFPKE